MSLAGTILIIEDDSTVSSLLHALLAPEGYSLIISADGQDGVIQAREHLPDVILLDLLLPGIDGFSVCRQLRADPVLAEVPVVMMTALHDRASRLEGIAAGADDFLTKPFDSMELVARVHTIVRLNRFRRLLTERERFYQIVERAEDGYVLLAEDGNITYANPTACNYLSLPETGYTDTSFLSHVKVHYHCEPTEAWLPWPPSPGEIMARFLIRPDTATTPACWIRVESLAHAPMPGSDILLCLTDVTAQQYQTRQQWSFQSLVAHKLLTPLNGLVPGLQLLADAIGPATDTEVTQSLGLVMESADRLHRDMMQVLRYLDSPLLVTPHTESCSISEMMTILQRLQQSLDLPRLTLFLPDFYTRSLNTGADTMELLLHELLKNAVKFHPTHRPEITVEGTIDADYLHIQLNDNGISVPPEQLNRIWNPNHQTEFQSAEEVSGLGSGLPMVASIVWSIGGRCAMRNRADGPGVCVELWLPLVGCAERKQL